MAEEPIQYAPIQIPITLRRRIQEKKGHQTYSKFLESLIEQVA